MSCVHAADCPAGAQAIASGAHHHRCAVARGGGAGCGRADRHQISVEATASAALGEIAADRPARRKSVTNYLAGEVESGEVVAGVPAISIAADRRAGRLAGRRAGRHDGQMDVSPPPSSLLEGC